MVRKLIDRPIAVTMSIVALIVLGVLALRYIPVSLMPDIDIPRITVQVPMPGSSARQVDERVVEPLRGQLMQVAGLQDLRSEARMDAGTIEMTFEPGSNMDLLFIEVNEKIDRTMGQLPRDLDRPKVIKASALDIPAFYLDLTLKADTAGSGTSLRFAQMSDFARNIVVKRLEQLPQTALVDVSGTVGTEILCTPDYARMEALGITADEIEQVIAQNDITLETLSVVDGMYRYNIHFDSQMLTVDDIRNIYFTYEGRLLRLGDLCDISEQASSTGGKVRSNGRPAVTMAIIKQSDAQMKDLQQSVDSLLSQLGAEYPDVDFHITRDQTRLLSYSIDNLQLNLLAGTLLASLVLFLFMRQWRMALLIVISIPLSLLLTLLCFYLLDISLNIISLSGLILGVGMIVDNSIIVIDNISGRQADGLSLREATVFGTNEVFTPMLSSVLTTCSVFIPLIFLSGTAGSLFYDQAMAVTFALFASLIVAVMVVPVYVYALKKRQEKKAAGRAVAHAAPSKFAEMPLRWYERTMNYHMRHRGLMLLFFCLMGVSIVLTASLLHKERLPQVPHDDALMSVDWNEGISVDENDRRVRQLLQGGNACLQTTTSMVGTQDFLLSHTPDITASEAFVYLKADGNESLLRVQDSLAQVIKRRYPAASVSFSESGNVYNLIFAQDAPDLDIRLQNAEGARPTVAQARWLHDQLGRRFPELTLQPIATDRTLHYVADMEQLAVHGVSYSQLYSRLQQVVGRSQVFSISDGEKNVPVLLGVDMPAASQLGTVKLRSSQGVDIPLSLLLRQSEGEDFKRLCATSIGDYVSVPLYAGDRMVRRVMAYTDSLTSTADAAHQLQAHYAGNYFESRALMGEVAVVLCVALALLFFILAAQFESIIQPLIILSEMVIDTGVVLLVLWALGESINLMSMTGLVVMSGIIVNDSILKVDTINRMRHQGRPLLRCIVEAGHRRFNPIVMTSLTTILAIVPFLSRGDMGSALQYPLMLTLIVGMIVGTLVSLFFVPMLYYMIYKGKGGARR